MFPFFSFTFSVHSNPFSLFLCAPYEYRLYSRPESMNVSTLFAVWSHPLILYQQNIVFPLLCSAQHSKLAILSFGEISLLFLYVCNVGRCGYMCFSWVMIGEEKRRRS